MNEQNTESLRNMRRFLASCGVSIAGLTNAELGAMAIKQGYRTHIDNSSALNTDELNALAGEPVTEKTEQVTEQSEQAEGLLAAFMNGGQPAFKQAITQLITQHAEELAKIPAPTNTHTVERIEVTVDKHGVEVQPKTDNIKSIGTKTLGELFPEITINRETLVECFDYQPSRPPTPYDMTHASNTSLLPVTTLFQKTGGSTWVNGERGTGKTTYCEYLAYKTGRPFFKIQHASAMEPLDLLGGMTLKDGKSEWADGLLIQAIRTPHAMILLDEPTLSPPACEMYRDLMDSGYKDLPTGERVHLAQGVTFMAADNTKGHGDDTGRFDGASTVSTPFIDRFAVIIELTYMQPEQEAKLLQKTGLDSTRADDIAEWAKRTRNSESGIDEPVSHRRLVALATMLAANVPHATAFHFAVLAHVRHETDREAYIQLANAHLNLSI